MPGLPERGEARDSLRDGARDGDRWSWPRTGWQRLDDERPPADTRTDEQAHDDADERDDWRRRHGEQREHRADRDGGAVDCGETIAHRALPEKIRRR